MAHTELILSEIPV